MQILSLETAACGCSGALINNGVIKFAEDNSANSHTKSILPMIDKLLADTNCKLDDLDALALDVGPGSFAGLRIGAGVAQGLAYAKDLPIINVSSLSAMALQADVDYAAVALDARMNEVYFATFARKSKTEFEILEKPQLLKPEEIKLDNDRKWCLVGNGWLEYKTRFESNIIDSYPTKNKVLPHAREIARLASCNNITKQTAKLAVPVYLRSAI